jgi:hypothetical protein
MMPNLPCLLAFVSVWFTIQAVNFPAAVQTRKLHYEPEKVTLRGRLVTKTFYGPPNYGESPATDSRETQYILLLDSPVDVVADPNDSLNQGELRVKQITLVVLDFKAIPVKPFLRQQVEVEGTLFHAHTGHHHTRILIQVSSLKRSLKSPSR